MHAYQIGPPSVPISALEHYAYCPRQAALIHVEGYFAANLDTIRGDLAHAAIDVPGAGRGRRDQKVWRSLAVRSQRLSLHGVCDIVQFTSAGPIPIEHKSGSYRPGGPTDLQVGAQALCLQEMFDRPVPVGVVFSGRDRRRHEIAITDDLTRRVEHAAHQMRVMLEDATTLPAPVNDHRCRRCSLREGCMPSAPHRAATSLFAPRPLGDWDD